MKEKPKLATVPEMLHDLEITLQMVLLESEKKNIDLSLLRQLTQIAKYKAIAIHGSLNY